MGTALRILSIVALLMGITVAAAATEESPPPSSGPHPVRIVAPGAGYRVYGWTPDETAGASTPVRGPDSRLVPLCSYVLGLSVGEGDPVVSTPFQITDTTREVVATIDPGTKYREDGLMLGMVSILAGWLLVATSVSETESECEQMDIVTFCSNQTDISFTRIFLGLSIAIGGGITGFRLAAGIPRADLQPR